MRYLYVVSVLLVGVFGPIQVLSEPLTNRQIVLEAESFLESSHPVKIRKGCVSIEKDEWLRYQINIPSAGRYKVEVFGGKSEAGVWIEDYIFNKDDRTYNITGNLNLSDKSGGIYTGMVDGSPLNEGIHDIKIHSRGKLEIDRVIFTRIQKHQNSPRILEQNMRGEVWELIWSDEFETDGLPDTNNWSYNIGNWGWGNNELQYYRDANLDNSRVENGNLIIQATKDNKTGEWSSARLTTQGKASFTYGKIEFRAKVPTARGTWAAGWLLGESYRDEVSWPYCGEIDVLECVGYEIDDVTGNGLNHATCHTRAYYFKQGNQIGSDTALLAMNTTYHTYAVEWYPDVIYGLIDGVRYYTYDKNANELEWPFNNPQSIIVNLAIGGGWGGAKGLADDLKDPQYIIDYVRVYQLK